MSAVYDRYGVGSSPFPTVGQLGTLSLNTTHHGGDDRSTQDRENLITFPFHYRQRLTVCHYVKGQKDRAREIVWQLDSLLCM